MAMHVSGNYCSGGPVAQCNYTGAFHLETALSPQVCKCNNLVLSFEVRVHRK